MTLDVLVAGGGPAGSAAAITLARAGLHVLLVDASTPEPHGLKVGESLPPAVRSLLVDLDVLDRLEAGGHLRSYGTTAAWGSERLVASDFIFDPQGHGWHLDRARFDRALRRAAADSGAHVLEAQRARVRERRSDGCWRIALASGRTVTARTIIDATGRRASIARTLGARRERRDRLVGIWGSTPARRGDTRADTLVEAVPGGWWYTALIPGRRRIAALMTDADLADPALRTSAGFAHAVARTRYLAPLIAESRVMPRVEPAHGSRLHPARGENWLAVGDAALAFDPLSSQGIMTALYTGMIGAAALGAYLDGDHTALSSYDARLAAVADAYDLNTHRAYRAESRWPDRPFWMRRAHSPHTRSDAGRTA